MGKNIEISEKIEKYINNFSLKLKLLIYFSIFSEISMFLPIYLNYIMTIGFFKIKVSSLKFR